MRFTRYVMVLSIMALITACGSDPTAQIYKETKANLLATEAALSALNSQLDSGTLRNAVLLQPYAKLAREKKPDFKQIIDVLASEGTKQGPTYKQIVERLKEVRPKASKKPDTLEEGKITNWELSNINAAISNYDAMLVDALNLLSEFTDGELPKMREIEFEGSNTASGDAGSEYVGNGNYGEWRTNSSGSSFWHWYGQYAFFSAMFRGPVYYDSWSNNRRPSYYHDRARGAYSSPSARSNQTQALNRTKKSYTARGKSFKSPYAKTTRVKGVSGSSMKSSASAKPFQSSYAKSASSSKSSASKTYKSGYNSRSSSSRRSSFGGK